VRRLFHLGQWRPGVDEGVEWELSHHFEERIEELMVAGLTRREAEAEAERAFGDVERVRAELRHLDRISERRLRMSERLEAMWLDVKYALRGMRRDPGLTLAVVLTLGLGVGANAAMFGVVDALLLRPLPWLRPAEVMQVEVRAPGQPRGMPYLQWELAREWQRRADFVEGTVLHNRASVLFTEASEPLTLAAQGVTAEFEETLGVQPAQGRGFVPEDMAPGAEAVALIDHAFWRNELGADAAIVGRVVELDGKPHRVIGVMPEGFKFPEYATTEFWLPLKEDGTLLGRPQPVVHAISRVADAAGVEARAAALGTSLLREQDPASRQTLGLHSLHASRGRNPGTMQAIVMLTAAVALILLVAGCNMINLLLVRATSRARELAIRMAVGASRGRVVRQLMTEAAVLSLLSGVVAVLLAMVALKAMQGIMPTSITFFAPYAIGMEGRALFFTFVVAAVSGLVFGSIPAIRAARQTAPAADAGLTTYAGRSRSSARLRRTLVVAETAISVMLLVGAALLIHNFVKLMAIDPGFEPERLAVMKLTISTARYPDAEQRTLYLQRLEERLEAVPGVTGVTLAQGLPPQTNLSFGVQLEAEGSDGPRPDQPQIVPNASVSPDFFDVVGAEIIAGRALARGDAAAENVVIDEHLARFLWPDGNAVGRRFRMGEQWEWSTVVGVMRDMQMLGPDDRSGDFEILFAMHEEGPAGYLAFAIRTEGDVDALLPRLRAAVREVDAQQPISELEAASTLYVETVDMPRFLLVLMATLGGLALILAGVGIFGVLSFGVSQRAHEMAVRMALGAGVGHVRALVLGEGMLLAAAGTVIGVAAAFAATRLIASALVQVTPGDPASYAVVVIATLTVALAACVAPARRATAIEPARVMRVQ